MFTDPTLDPTRRMLLKQNEIQREGESRKEDEEGEFSPDSDMDTLPLRLDGNDIRSFPKLRGLGPENFSDPLLVAPSLLRTKRRRRIATWLLNSIHHPRLPLLALCKYLILYETIQNHQNNIIITMACIELYFATVFSTAAVGASSRAAENSCFRRYPNFICSV